MKPKDPLATIDDIQLTSGALSVGELPSTPAPVVTRLFPDVQPSILDLDPVGDISEEALHASWLRFLARRIGLDEDGEIVFDADGPITVSDLFEPQK